MPPCRLELSGIFWKISSELVVVVPRAAMRSIIIVLRPTVKVSTRFGRFGILPRPVACG